MVIYSRAADDADNDLQFKLRRSIQIAKENKVANKKNGKKKSERATVSRERRLALALRAVLDAYETVDEAAQEIEHTAAVEILNDLGYGSLIGIPKRLKELKEQLEAAVAAGDGATIARIGAEMVKVQAGKDVAEKPKAVGGE